MKTIRLKSSLLAAVCALLALLPWFRDAKTQGLTDITQPYLGTYECRLARWGDQDLLENFDYIRLELKKKNECVLRYRQRKQPEKTETGEYTYDKDRQTISFYIDKAPMIKREFPVKRGVIYITLNKGAQTLSLQFHQT